MMSVLLLIVAVASMGPSLTFWDVSAKPADTQHSVTLNEAELLDVPGAPFSLKEVNQLLHSQAPSLSQVVINKVLSTLNCAYEHNVRHNDILTIIDYSMPSSAKRLWVFNLKEKKLLFHTYVSHGIKSGTEFSQFFSNTVDSKASSIGVYRTEKAYYGREGLSLRLEGLERNFNNNAFNRYIVMHGGWYMDEEFIKKYGRAGRSWGCPAVPLSLYRSIITTIKENSLFVVYYPSDEWLVQSKFLNCNKNFPTQKLHTLLSEAQPVARENEQREAVLFADLKHNNTLEENDPIVVMAADQYQQTYHTKAPLGRMLRRQIAHMEYVALSRSELNQIAAQPSGYLDKIHFVKPEIIMVHGGYYETQMKLVNLGKIKEIQLDPGSLKRIGEVGQYTIYFESNAVVKLKSTDRFIRWVGL